MLLSKNAILKTDDRVQEEVEVPEWGGHVIVRSISGAERDNFEKGLSDDKGKVNISNIRAKLCAITMVDADRKPLFSGTSDVVALGNKSAAALDRVFTVAKRLNGLLETDIKEIVKNSEATRADDSTSS